MANDRCVHMLQIRGHRVTRGNVALPRRRTKNARFCSVGAAGDRRREHRIRSNCFSGYALPHHSADHNRRLNCLYRSMGTLSPHPRSIHHISRGRGVLLLRNVCARTPRPHAPALDIERHCCNAAIYSKLRVTSRHSQMHVSVNVQLMSCWR